MVAPCKREREAEDGDTWVRRGAAKSKDPLGQIRLISEAALCHEKIARLYALVPMHTELRQKAAHCLERLYHAQTRGYLVQTIDQEIREARQIISWIYYYKK